MFTSNEVLIVVSLCFSIFLVSRVFYTCLKDLKNIKKNVFFWLWAYLVFVSIALIVWKAARGDFPLFQSVEEDLSQARKVLFVSEHPNKGRLSARSR